MIEVIDVAVPLPPRNPFSYLPPEVAAEPLPGCRVRVPFGPRTLVGFVTGRRTVESAEGLKRAIELLDTEPILQAQQLELARRMARRYLCGIGEVLQAFLPAGIKKGSRGRSTTFVLPVRPAADEALASSLTANREQLRREILRLAIEHPEGLPRQTLLRLAGASSDSPVKTLIKAGLLVTERREDEADVFAHLDLRQSRAPKLMRDQERAAEAICRAVDSERHRGFLLHGVTGSGKTEVYLAALRRCLERERGAIVLVPEISLTPQTIERFESRFGSVAVLHSHLTDAERARQWQLLRAGSRRIAIGPRSAIFAPVDRLGLVILDEEHENTFKQQNTPRYHARDVALERGRLESATVVLGSATPSLESWEAARRGQIDLLQMPTRVREIPLPVVSVVDMRSQRPTGPGGVFSPLLVNWIRDTLDRKEQVLLFLNRRGYNTNLMCRACGHVFNCRSCDVPLTFYREQGRVLCHHCGHTARPPERCSECRHHDIHFKGFGTELVEHAVRRFFPKARVARMDGESMRKRHAHTELFRDLREGEIDILVGTQMAAKGLDFPGITLIGVISADTSLLIPDFRAAERTFQLMTQVAGRAGRGQRPGRVLIQTYTPDHYAYRTAAAHDFETFAETELEYRRHSGYPPFGSLVRVLVQGAEEDRVIERVEKVAQALMAAAMAHGVTVLGPAPCPLAFIKKQHRRHILLRADEGESLERLVDDVEAALRSDRKIQVLVDRDPSSMM